MHTLHRLTSGGAVGDCFGVLSPLVDVEDHEGSRGGLESLVLLQAAQHVEAHEVQRQALVRQASSQPLVQLCQQDLPHFNHLVLEKAAMLTLHLGNVLIYTFSGNLQSF